jgi:hypothetical protein
MIKFLFCYQHFLWLVSSLFLCTGSVIYSLHLNLPYHNANQYKVEKLSKCKGIDLKDLAGSNSPDSIKNRPK